MNAYLPSLAKEAPEVLALSQPKSPLDPETHSGSGNGTNRRSMDSENSDDTLDHSQREVLANPLLSTSTTSSIDKKVYDEALSAATSRISALGIALGYAAGIVLLLLTLIPVTQLNGSTFSLRLAIGLSGIWWAVFSIPSALWLPSGYDDTEESEDGEGPVRPRFKLGPAIVGAWKRLGAMLTPSEIKKLRNTFKYLAAWFLLSDGLSILFIQCFLSLTRFGA
jgi:UMF1 family MFS transporter